MPGKVRIVAIVLFGVTLAVACVRVDVGAIAAAVARAQLPLVALAAALAVVARTLVRAKRTQALIGERLPLRELVWMHLAGYAAGTALPGPAEEVLCCAYLARQRGFAPRALLRLQVLDKALGIASVAVLALALLPPVAAVPLAALAAVVLGVALPARAPLVAWLVLSNALCVAMIGLCFVAVGADVTPVGWLEVFLATSLSGALAVLPGQLGTLEAAFTVASAQHGAPAALAIAAALLYRLLYAPTAIAGLPLLWRLSAARPA